MIFFICLWCEQYADWQKNAHPYTPIGFDSPIIKKLLQTEETEKKILTPFLFKRSTRHKTWAYQPFCCHSCIELEQRLLLHRGVLLFDDFNREIPVAF